VLTSIIAAITNATTTNITMRLMRKHPPREASRLPSSANEAKYEGIRVPPQLLNRLIALFKNFVEGVFCELRVDGVLRTSLAFGQGFGPSGHQKWPNGLLASRISTSIMAQ
jgi:hypothetical protein